VLIELLDESECDELLRLGRLRPRVALGYVFENGLEAFEARVLFFREESFCQHFLPAFFQNLSIDAASHVLAYARNVSFLSIHILFTALTLGFTYLLTLFGLLRINPRVLTAPCVLTSKTS